jgi:hypothetical protein
MSAKPAEKTAGLIVRQIQSVIKMRHVRRKKWRRQSTMFIKFNGLCHPTEGNVYDVWPH